MNFKDAFSRRNVMKVLKFGVLLGGGFGLIIILIYNMLPSAAEMPWWVALVIPLFAAALSGLAGMGGILLDWLLGRKLADPRWREMATFGILAFVVIGGVGVFVMRFDRSVQRQYFWGALIGCGFGAVVSYLDYRFRSMHQRVANLEKENRLLAEIARKDRQLQEAARNLAVAEERNRIARELHDSVSQGVHGIIYTVRSLRRSLPATGGRIAEILGHLERSAAATLDELRAMIMELKPTSLDERGLIEALRLNAELFAGEHQLDLALALDPCPGLTPGQEMALYRIAQEALANIGRHAKATRVGLSLRCRDRRACLRVEDDGMGFDPNGTGRGDGLVNMAARCRENGGEFSVLSSPGGGTAIEAAFPLGT